MRIHPVVMVAVTIVGAALAACGGDDTSGASSSGGTDGGASSSGDTGAGDTGGSSSGGDTGAGDTGASSGDGGGALSCATYCDKIGSTAVAGSCTGTDTQYATRDQCMHVCGFLSLGAAADTKGDTVGLPPVPRRQHARRDALPTRGAVRR